MRTAKPFIRVSFLFFSQPLLISGSIDFTEVEKGVYETSRVVDR